MKILALTAGSDRPETALLCGLAKKGYEVAVLGTPSEELKVALLSAGVKVQDFKVKSRFDFQAASKLKAKIREFKPDIVHAFTGRTLAAAVRIKSGFKTKDGYSFALVTYRGTVGHLSRLDPGSICSFLSPKVDSISCVSDAVRDYLLKRKVKSHKLVTVYKGHDPIWYQNSSSLKKSDLNISEDSFTFICVANSRPVKGVDVFIDAANRLSDNPDLSFLIVGEIRDEKLRRRAKNPKIHFAGFRQDAQALIAMSDCLVVPSKAREGLPKSLLEALALGKAVIASRVGGIPEVISNEQQGLLIPPRDSALLARTMLFLSKNPDRAFQIGAAGHSRLLNGFNISQMIEKTEKLYANLTKKIKV